MAAKANYEAKTREVGRRVSDLQKRIIDSGTTDEATLSLLNELLEKIAMAKYQQQQEH